MWNWINVTGLEFASWTTSCWVGSRFYTAWFLALFGFEHVTRPWTWGETQPHHRVKKTHTLLCLLYLWPHVLTVVYTRMETTLKLLETCEEEDLSRSSESSRTWSARRTKASEFFSHTGPLSPEECPFVNLDRRRCAASVAPRSSAPTPVLTTPRRVLQIHVLIRTLFVPVTLTSSGLVYSSGGAWLVLGLPWTKEWLQKQSDGSSLRVVMSMVELEGEYYWSLRGNSCIWGVPNNKKMVQSAISTVMVILWTHTYCTGIMPRLSNFCERSKIVLEIKTV